MNDTFGQSENQHEEETIQESVNNKQESKEKEVHTAAETKDEVVQPEEQVEKDLRTLNLEVRLSPTFSKFI
jgi:hypothetical protein